MSKMILITIHSYALKQNRYPDIEELQPPASYRNASSSQANVVKSETDITSDGTNLMTNDNNLTNETNLADDAAELSAPDASKPGHRDDSPYDELAETGLMIKNSGIDMQNMSEVIPNTSEEDSDTSEYYSKLASTYVANMDPKVVDFLSRKLAAMERKRAEKWIEARLKTEFGVEDTPRAIPYTGENPDAHAPETAHQKNPMISSGTHAKSVAVSSNAARMPTELSWRIANRQPLVDDIVGSAQGRAVSRLHELRSPLDQFQYDLCQRVGMPSSSSSRQAQPPAIPMRSPARMFLQAQPPAMPTRSPARMFLPQNNGNSPYLSRQMRSTPFYQLIPADSTPVPSNKEWNQGSSQH